MSAPRRASRTTSQPAGRLLSEQDIVDAALRLIRKDGADKLSMRALAAQLGVTPMAIYYHVPNKEALLDRVVDAVLGSVPMPAPNPERWEAQMKAYMLVTRQLVFPYPGLSRVIIERPHNKAARALAHYGISVLLAAGFDEREAALAITTYHTYLYGVYGAMSAQAGAGGRVRSARTQAGAKSASDSDRVAAVVRHLREMRVEDSLDYGIDAVIEGISARAKRKRSARSASALR